MVFIQAIATLIAGVGLVQAINKPTITTTTYTIPDTVTYTVSTYTPSSVEYPGAIYTTTMTRTLSFDPSTYTAAPTDTCYGGVIIFNVTGDVSDELSTGSFLAEAAYLSGTSYTDYHVYNSVYSATTLTTTITTMLCSETAFTRTYNSVVGVPDYWIAISSTCTEFISPNSVSKKVCSFCPPGNFQVGSACYPCSPVPNCLPTDVQCTTPGDSMCAIACPPIVPVPNCKAGKSYCDMITNTNMCEVGECEKSYYRDTTTGQCLECTPSEHCLFGHTLCSTATSSNFCEATYCTPGYWNLSQGGPCSACNTIANCVPGMEICSGSATSICAMCMENYSANADSTACLDLFGGRR